VTTLMLAVLFVAVFIMVAVWLKDELDNPQVEGEVWHDKRTLADFDDQPCVRILERRRRWR